MTETVTYALIVSMFASLGPAFDHPPKTVAVYETEARCRTEADLVHQQSGKGNNYIAVCQPVRTTAKSRCNESPFTCGLMAFFGQRI